MGSPFIPTGASTSDGSSFEPSNTLTVKNGTVYAGVDAQGLDGVFVDVWGLEPGANATLEAPDGTTYGPENVTAAGIATFTNVSLSVAGTWLVTTSVGGSTTFDNDPNEGAMLRTEFTDALNDGNLAIKGVGVCDNQHHAADLYAEQTGPTATATSYNGEVCVPITGGYYQAYADYECSVPGWVDECTVNIHISGGQSKKAKCGDSCSGTIKVWSPEVTPPDKNGGGGYVEACDWWCRYHDVDSYSFVTTIKAV